MRRVHVTVSGDVQGVGYRYATAGRARRSGLSGWVRNRRDGTVEAELEGADRQVCDMLAWMAQGPPAARVTAVRTTDVAPTGETGFDVRASA